MKNWLLIIVFALSLITTSEAQILPAGFKQLTVGNVYYPTSMAFTPDDRIFVTEKAGKVKIIKDGKVLPKPFLTINVNQLNERGLDGIALDPDFKTNHYVYIYYTTADSPVHNRLSRYTASGDTAMPGSQFTVLDLEPLVNSIHEGGSIVFGPDGKLYLGVGEDHVPLNSQNLNVHKGKILRINKEDGSAAEGNPFSGSPAAERIWVYGLRNPYTLSYQSDPWKLYANDVGEGTWEEIDDVTKPGQNFGWPIKEGRSNDTTYKNPVYTYKHGQNDTMGCAISGGCFFTPSSTNYPTEYYGKYFFIDYCSDWINYMDANGVVKKFASGMPGSRVILQVGPDGNLYYFSIAKNTLYKITDTVNAAPVITSQPKTISLTEFQTAIFSVSATGASPLNFQWRHNGINISGANLPSYIIPDVMAGDSGTYSVIVSNTVGKDTSDNARLSVKIKQIKAVILSPLSTKLYRGGDTIHYSGKAIDDHGVILPASTLKWKIEFHYSGKVITIPNITSGVDNDFYIIPDTGYAGTNGYYRWILIADNGAGIRDTAVVNIKPMISNIRLNTSPPGLALRLNNASVTSPYSAQLVVGMKRKLEATSPQTLNNASYDFEKWSDNGDTIHNISVPAAHDSIFEAKFKLNTSGITRQNEVTGKVKIYPNPNHGQFNIEFPERIKGKINIEVVNILGETIYLKESTIKESTSVQINLDNNKTADGTYSLRLVTENGTKYFKFILTK